MPTSNNGFNRRLAPAFDLQADGVGVCQVWSGFRSNKLLQPKGLIWMNVQGALHAKHLKTNNPRRVKCTGRRTQWSDRVHPLAFDRLIFTAMWAT